MTHLRLIPAHLFFAASLLPVFPAVLAANPAPAIESTIERVTVFADRAEVTRVGTLSGVRSVRFAGLPGWVDEESVRVRLSPAQGMRIADIRVQREFLAQASDAAVREAEAAVQQLDDQMRRLNADRQVLQQSREHLDKIVLFSADKLPRDGASRPVPPDEYAGFLDFVTERLQSLLEQEIAIEERERALRPQRSAAQQALNELRARRSLRETVVTVSFDQAPSRETTVELTYMLPGASWEPAHELRVANGGGEVRFVSYAVVSQTTGENWDGAELTFSTQSSSAPQRIPELTALILGREPGQPPLVAEQANARGAKKGFARARRDQERNQSVYLRLNAAALSIESDFSENIISNRDMQERARVQFERIEQKRGTTAIYTARRTFNIRTDGNTVRVPVAEAQLPSKHQLLAMPEMSLNVFRALELSNAGAQPILPGSVALFVDEAFQGTTVTDFAAPGEAFTVFLGLEDRVKIARRLDREESRLWRSDRYTEMDVAIIVELENLSGQPLSLVVTERIPQAKTKDVRVRGVDLSPRIEPDDDGMARWTVDLAPQTTQALNIGYDLRYPTVMTAAASSEAGTPQEQPSASPIFKPGKILTPGGPSTNRHRVEGHLRGLEKLF
ncbi:MAG: mucoidy inhibitor MuiA family protein [Opitutales bacterium]